MPLEPTQGQDIALVATPISSSGSTSTYDKKDCRSVLEIKVVYLLLFSIMWQTPAASPAISSEITFFYLFFFFSFYLFSFFPFFLFFSFPFFLFSFFPFFLFFSFPLFLLPFFPFSPSWTRTLILHYFFLFCILGWADSLIFSIPFLPTRNVTKTTPVTF